MYIQMISIHGLVRGTDLEMGRDADTGGQVRYVVELAKALGECEGVEQVDLFTRLLHDKRVSRVYSQPVEPLGPRSRIVRLPCGGGKYVRKERLWPTLEEFIDQMIAFTRRENRVPTVVHGHYSDAGYVARQVASAFGVPFIFSGHSLGRAKKAYLLEQGNEEEAIEREYHISRRIAEEESSLAEAELVVVSTRYEQQALYGLYQQAATPRYEVIPPGLELSRFFPYYNYDLPGETVDETYKQARVRMTKELQRFFFRMDKPLILSVGRPEKGKNIRMLVECYGRDKELQAIANLAVFAGIRKDIEQMNPNEQEVLTEMLMLMDRYDLYGKMAAPKQHSSETDVPELYRLAASGRGIFVSPALVETFGLTLLESAATGLPFIGTRNGGPVDIVENTESGVLVDLESDPAHFLSAMKGLLTDEQRWQRLSENGINRVRERYTWRAHCEKYLESVRKLESSPAYSRPAEGRHPVAGIFSRMERLLITDVDDTLMGDRAALELFKKSIGQQRSRIGIGVATGRTIDSAKAALAECGLQDVDVVISSVGAEIHYGRRLTPDLGWASHVRYRWYPERIRSALAGLPFLTPQEPSAQRELKISYILDTRHISAEEALPRVHEALGRASAAYTAFFSHGCLLDVLPCRASKGKAIRYLSFKWGIPPNRIITAGNSGNDEDMLLGRVAGIVVGNHEQELEKLRSADWVYFAKASYAAGILEGLEHYHLL